MKKLLFEGVCTASVTPIKNGKVDYESMVRLIELQYAAGVRAIVVTGTTGESATLTDSEKKKLWRCAVQNAPKDMTILAGCGSNDTAHTVKLCKAAENCGAAGLLVVTPYYNKATQQGLLRHYAEIANAVDLPIIAYNVPSRTGMDCTAVTYTQLAKFENIIGAKEASDDFEKIQKVIRICGDDFYIWSGNDQTAVPMTAIGAKGVISVLSNLCPTETVSMMNACRSGDFSKAGRMQCAYAELISALFCEVNPIPIKAAMNLLGLEVGDVRLPLCGLSPENELRLQSVLQQYHLL